MPGCLGLTQGLGKGSCVPEMWAEAVIKTVQAQGRVAMGAVEGWLMGRLDAGGPLNLFVSIVSGTSELGDSTLKSSSLIGRIPLSLKAGATWRAELGRISGTKFVWLRSA